MRSFTQTQRSNFEWPELSGATAVRIEFNSTRYALNNAARLIEIIYSGISKRE